jgi:serine/threonine-protein kinase RsbT
VRIELVRNERKTGIRLVFEDQGPGIADIGQAMTEGFTTGHGMGLGLSGAKRLSNEFEIDSRPGEGTRVSILRWK